MEIIDSHIHIDVKNKLNIIEYLKDTRIKGANIILNTYEEKKCFIELSNLIKMMDKKIQLTINLDYREKNDDFISILEKDGYLEYALKLHPRFEKYTIHDVDNIVEYIKNFNFKFIVVDAFYYGIDMDKQISKELILRLSTEFPHKKIIVAHSGGHRVIEYMLTMKKCENVYYDISYINYFKFSSIILDFRQLIVFNSDRVLFGTDFPTFKLDETLNLFIDIIKSVNTDKKLLEKILILNYINNFI